MLNIGISEICMELSGICKSEDYAESISRDCDDKTEDAFCKNEKDIYLRVDSVDKGANAYLP